MSIFTQVENGGGVSPIFDVAGYYADDGGTPGARYQSIEPVRLFDTRSGHGPVEARPGVPARCLRSTSRVWPACRRRA